MFPACFDFRHVMPYPYAAMSATLCRGMAIPVVAAFLVTAGLCAVEATVLTPHLAGPDGCCGLPHCPVLPIALLTLALWATEARLGPATRSAIRFAIHDPPSPPPELILSGSA